MTFMSSGNTYDSNDPDLSNFKTNTHLHRDIQNVRIIYNFSIDMKYDLNYGDKKSDRYQIIKNLFQLQSGSGLYVFLPSVDI